MIKLIVVLLVLAASGCSSIDRRFNGPAFPFVEGELYAGTRRAYKVLGMSLQGDCENMPWLCTDAPINVPLYSLDTALSAVVDTVCLPYDVVSTREKWHSIPQERQVPVEQVSLLNELDKAKEAGK